MCISPYVIVRQSPWGSPLGTQNETGEVHVGAFEANTKVVAKLLVVKLFCIPNTIYYFRNISTTHTYNESCKVIYLADYLKYCFEEVTKIMSFLMHRHKKTSRRYCASAPTGVACAAGVMQPRATTAVKLSWIAVGWTIVKIVCVRATRVLLWCAISWFLVFGSSVLEHFFLCSKFFSMHDLFVS